MSGADPASTRLSSREYWSTAFDSRLSAIGNVTADSDCEDIRKAHGVIADEISSLQLLLCFARRRCNALTITSRLSSELLTHIFSFLVDRSERSILGWIKVTHVCHRWREAALQQPRLWSELTFSRGTRWFLEMVSRAKSVPLVLTRDGSLPKSLDDGLLISKIMSRVEHISLASGNRQLPTFAPLLTQSVPLLKTFILECREDYNDLAARQSKRVPSATPSLFAAQASQLQRFHLHGCKMLGIFPPSPNITHFHIYGFSSRRQSPPTYAFTSFTDLLQSIKNMPRLERLDLSNNLFPRFEISQGETNRQACGRFHLSSLKHLCIGDTPFECAVLMQHLSILSSASFSLRCIGRGTPEDFPLLFDALHWYANNFKADTTLFSIWASGDSSKFKLMVECCTSDDEADRCSSLHANRPRMELSVREVGNNVIPAFLNAFGYENIRTVSVGGRYGLTPPWWSKMDSIRAFECCHNVEHIRLSGRENVRRSIQTLNTSSEGKEGQSSRSIHVFPALSSVWLHDMDLVAPECSISNPWQALTHEDLKEDIIKMATSRQGILKTIYTRDSSLPESFAVHLSRLVTIHTDHAVGPPFVPGPQSRTSRM